MQQVLTIRAPYLTGIYMENGSCGFLTNLTFVGENFLDLFSLWQ